MSEGRIPPPEDLDLGENKSQIAPSSTRKTCGSFYFKIFILLVIIAVVLVGIFRQYIQNLFDWVSGTGYYGLLVILVLYVVFALILAPVWFFALFLSYSFGFSMGLGFTNVGYFLCSSANFLLGRYRFSQRLQRRLEEEEEKDKVDILAGRSTGYGSLWPYIRADIDKMGFIFVLVVHFAPFIPFGLTTYIFGITNVRYITFIVATLLGLLPKNILYCLLGTAIKNINDLVRAAQGETGGDARLAIILWVGIGLLIIILGLLVFLIRRAFLKRLHDQKLFRENNQQIETSIDFPNNNNNDTAKSPLLDNMNSPVSPISDESSAYQTFKTPEIR